MSFDMTLREVRDIRHGVTESWRTRHMEHFPGPTLESYDDDYDSVVVSCSCGEAHVFRIRVAIEEIDVSRMPIG